MKLDILAFGAHPDDVELGCSGSLALAVDQGKNIGIIHLTRGELGTRGSAQLRDVESANAAKILKAQIMENLCLPDGFLAINPENVLKAVVMIRKYQPDLILANSPRDRHPDHGMGSQLVDRAMFLAGLPKVLTEDKGNPQAPWRTSKILFYIQDRFSVPDIVVDISDYIQTKMDSISAYSSQFYNPDSNEPVTPISTPEFFEGIKARAREVGHAVKVPYGEGFLSQIPLKVSDLSVLL